jgi:hypothetical protein
VHAKQQLLLPLGSKDDRLRRRRKFLARNINQHRDSVERPGETDENGMERPDECGKPDRNYLQSV